MAERQRRATHYEVRLDYFFDRLLEAKLVQAYELLVSDHVRLASSRSHLTEASDDSSSDLRPRVLGQAARGAHDRESDGRR
jgi:hypothetical protein